ncbi:MAG: ABC transporter ATP-binding protein [Candidatus Kariarchaeaceae archaeon]
MSKAKEKASSSEEIVSKNDYEYILEIKNLKKFFPVSEQTIIFSRTIAFIQAVNNISFKLIKGETLGLVGESGCGKTTVAKLILKLEKPTSGDIFYRGLSILDATDEDLRNYRTNVQMVFQDPYSSLNPRMTVMDIIKEAFDIQEAAAYKLKIHENKELAEQYPKLKLMVSLTEAEKRERVLKLLNVVGLESYHALRYPHEFSGGQRQRIGIARALAVNPEIIVADEPVSALDVSIQAQILNLLKSIQKQFNLTYIFVAHDLSVVKHVSDRIAVMYLGKIMELTDKGTLYRKPMHPYTISLMSAIPRVNPKLHTERIVLEGDVPSPINPPPGCVFSSRCYKAKPDCSEKVPDLIELKSGQYVACLYPENID